LSNLLFLMVIEKYIFSSGTNFSSC